MGDPARLAITAIAVKYGWVPPPDEEKSDFDILPLMISDEETGHDKPQIFPLLSEQVLEVPIEHPEHEAFADLNLRWYALPAISNIGVDIGGVVSLPCAISASCVQHISFIFIISNKPPSYSSISHVHLMVGMPLPRLLVTFLISNGMI